MISLAGVFAIPPAFGLRGCLRLAALTCYYLSAPAGLIRAQTGMVRQIIAGPGLDIDVAPSSDGKQLVYASSRGGALEIWLRDVDGGPLQQITTTSRNSVDRYPNFAPDGRSIFFQSDRSGGIRNIWMIDLGTRALSQLTSFVDGAGASHPVLSPDGRNICFTRTTASGSVSIWLIGIDGRGARELSTGVDCAWLPDGRVVFSRPSDLQNPQRYDLWVVSPSADPGRTLVASSQPWVRNPVPSRDGRWLAYTVYEAPPAGDIQENWRMQ